MSWGEAVRITGIVIKHEQGTPLHAALAEWQFPATPEWIVTARLLEMVAHAHFENAAEHRLPMPWDEPPPQPRAMPREELMAILNRQRALPPQNRAGRVKDVVPGS